MCVCLRKIIKRLKWTAVSFLSSFSYSHFPLRLTWLRGGGKEIDDSRPDDSRTVAARRYLEPKRTGKDHRVGVYVYILCDWSSKSTDEMLWWFSDFFLPFFYFLFLLLKQENVDKKMAFHQFSRLDGAPLLPPLKVRFRWGYLFIFLLVSWWKSTSGYLLCLLVCRVLAAMCEKDEQSLLLLLPPFFKILSLPFIHFPLGPWRNGAETGPSFQRRHDGQPAPAGFGRVVYFSLSISFSLCMCVCVCVCALCSFGRGYNQPAKKEKKGK